MHTGLFGLAVDPLGDGEMDLLTRDGFGLVGFLEAVPDKVGTYVGVCYVSHTRRPPKRHRSSCCARHLSFFQLLIADAFSFTAAADSLRSHLPATTFFI